MKTFKMLLAGLLVLGLQGQSFAMLAEVKTGPVAASDGSVSPQRSDKTGALVNTEAHGRYQEATYRGNIYSLDSGAAYTIVAANATVGVEGTEKFINGFFNPPGSGKAAVILNANVSTVSGTPGGPLVWNYFCGLTDTAAATGTIRSGLLSNTNGASAMSPRVNVTLGIPQAITFLQLSTLGGPAAAAAAGGGTGNVTEDVAGRIIVPPGCDFGIAAAAAGTSHIVFSSLAWEEIPYP